MDIKIDIQCCDSDADESRESSDCDDEEKDPLTQRAVSHSGVIIRDVLTNVSYIRPDGNVSDAVIVVIPGNPGVIGFYDKFIEYLYSSYQIPIYGISYAGHDLVRAESEQALLHRMENHPRSETTRNRVFSLEQQISHKLSFVRNHLEPGKKLILIAHSLGCYIALNMLKKEEFADRVCLCIMLFPVIERTMDTVSGKRWVPLTQTLCKPSVFVAESLSSTTKKKLADAEATRRRISRHSRNSFSNGMQPLLSANGLKNMSRIAKDLSKIGKLSSLRSPIKKNKDKLVFYYGAKDDWTPLSFYTEMKTNFPDVDIRFDGRCIEHAFVFRNSLVVAKVVAEIISEKTSAMQLDLPTCVERMSKHRFAMARAKKYKHYSFQCIQRLENISEDDTPPTTRRSHRGSSV